MQLAAALRAFLLSKSSIVAAVGDRVRLTDTVPEFASLPDVFFTVESVPELPGDSDDLNQYFVTVVARSFSVTQSNALAALLVSIIPELENAAITASGETAAPFESVSLEDEGTDEDPEQISGAQGSARWVYATSIQFSCWFRTTAVPIDVSGATGQLLVSSPAAVWEIEFDLATPPPLLVLDASNRVILADVQYLKSGSRWVGATVTHGTALAGSVFW